MAAVVAPNASPAGVLRLIRGAITAARPAYPDVIHLEIRDPHGGIWKLDTQDADWSPSDPQQLIDKSIERADLDEETGELRLALSGGLDFKVVPAPQEADDDPPNWKLFTPEDLVLVFGPGGRWQFKRADDSVGSLMGGEKERTSSLFSRASALPRVEDVESQILSWVVEERAETQNTRMLLIVAFGLSVTAIAIAAASLALALR